MAYKAPVYTPTAVPGDSRRRIWRLLFENPLNGTPSATLHEEEVILTKDGVEQTLRRTRDIALNYSDPNEVMNKLHPQDESVIGTLTFMDAFLTLFALGRHAEHKQDVIDQAVAEAQEKDPSS